jgi:DNA helicase-2/ATP-dependent DNA helicase PcrA
MQPDELLRDLTEPQREAVTHADGPLLVLAGAGSGKTRVITRRAAYLAATVTRPCHVAAITFTNKAANEMRQRIAALGLAGMTVATFHSLCARLLRAYAGQAGLKSNFSIYDESDRNEIVREAVAESDLALEQWPVARVVSAVSLAKNHMLTPAEYAGKEVQDFGARTIARIWTKYDELMRQRNAVDFDDLLVLVARMLEEKPEIRDDLEETYRYLLIDEYQDTNLAQFEIARRLCRRRQNICATGDPDQSIYGWRGATISNILEFEQHFPNAKVVKLEQNYRSTPRILAAASQLIASNKRRKEKTLWTHNDDGPPVRVVECEDADSEAEFVARSIADLASAGTALKDVAIFCRINSLTRVLETALRKHRLAYQVARGVEFYSRKEIKDTVSYLRVLANPDDDVSLARIINVPTRGIGATSIARLSDHARAHNKRLIDALREVDRIESLGRAAAKIKRFVKMLDELRGAVGKPLRELIETVLDITGLEDEFRQTSTDDNNRVANVEELISSAAKFQEESDEPNLVNFLSQVSLVSDQDAIKSESGCVTVMTLHAAKGLEFPVVFMVGLEDGVLPHARARDDPHQMEEERRLCFVGITRTMRQLTMTRARRRRIRGTWIPTVRSPFLMELPLKEVEWQSEQEGQFRTGRPIFGNGGAEPFPTGPWPQRRSEAGWERQEHVDGDERPKHWDDDDDPQADRERHEAGRERHDAGRSKSAHPGSSAGRTGGGSAHGIKVGQLVTHGRYGVGRVASIDGWGDDAKASVEFKPPTGRRTFFLKFGTIRPAR